MSIFKVKVDVEQAEHLRKSLNNVLIIKEIYTENLYAFTAANDWSNIKAECIFASNSADFDTDVFACMMQILQSIGLTYEMTLRNDLILILDKNEPVAMPLPLKEMYDAFMGSCFNITDYVGVDQLLINSKQALVTTLFDLPNLIETKTTKINNRFKNA